MLDIKEHQKIKTRLQETLTYATDTINLRIQQKNAGDSGIKDYGIHLLLLSSQVKHAKRLILSP
jgi:hypothetical protein